MTRGAARIRRPTSGRPRVRRCGVGQGEGAGPGRDGAVGRGGGAGRAEAGARYLRKEFELGKPVKRAMVHLSGHGASELYLNGKKVGDHVLSPALSEYDKRVLYVTHDVTAMLKEGKNAAGAILGTGATTPRGSVRRRPRGPTAIRNCCWS